MQNLVNAEKIPSVWAQIYRLQGGDEVFDLSLCAQVPHFELYQQHLVGPMEGLWVLGNEGDASGGNQDILPPYPDSQPSINPAGVKVGKAGHLQSSLAPNHLPLPAALLTCTAHTPRLQTLGIYELA